MNVDLKWGAVCWDSWSGGREGIDEMQQIRTLKEATLEPERNNSIGDMSHHQGVESSF